MKSSLEIAQEAELKPIESIAEEAGIPMPSFFGYLLKWAVPILIPLFVVVSLIFFL